MRGRNDYVSLIFIKKYGGDVKGCCSGIVPRISNRCLGDGDCLYLGGGWGRGAGLLAGDLCGALAHFR